MWKLCRHGLPMLTSCPKVSIAFLSFSFDYCLPHHFVLKLKVVDAGGEVKGSETDARHVVNAFILREHLVRFGSSCALEEKSIVHT